MNLEKINPWNWFKHENHRDNTLGQVPVKRGQVNALTPNTNADSLFQLHREMDRLFDDVFRSFGVPSLRTSFPEQSVFRNDTINNYLDQEYRPQVDIAGDDNHYEIMLNVPGLSAEEVTIEVQDDRLMIRGKTEEAHETKEKHYYRVERSVGSFQRTLALPEDAQSDEISANLKDGVLVLAIPRRHIERRDVKKIPIAS